MSRGRFSADDRPNILLWDALLAGVPVPSGTGSTVVDGVLIVSRIRPRYLWPAYLCFELFDGRPVRGVLAVCEWAAKAPEEEQIRMLRNWQAKRSGRGGRSMQERSVA